MKYEPLDQVNLKKRVQSDEISWQDALQAITSLRSPPWQSKEWKAKRLSDLRKRCVQCGKSDPPLVLQHTWHPTPTAQIFYDLRSKHLNEWNAWQLDHPIQLDLSAVPADTDVCPKCLSPTLRYRKTMKNWKCVAQEGGVFCGYEFDRSVRVVSKAKINELTKAARRKSMEEFDSEFGIGKAAVILIIEQHLRYISFQDVTTLCKRCAFVADRTTLVFCKICRSNYHFPSFACCTLCARGNTKTHLGKNS